MSLPPLRSLRARWTLVLVGVCVLEAALVAVAVRVSTERAFDRFVVEEALEAFVADVVVAVQTTGTVTAESVEDVRSARGTGRAGRTRGDDRPPRPDRPPARRRPPVVEIGRGIAFGLADADGRVLRPFDGHAEGDVLPPEVLGVGRAVVVDGRRVATALVPEGAADALDGLPASSPEARFLASSTTALLAALALALAVSVAIGVWLAGRTVRRTSIWRCSSATGRRRRRRKCC